MLDNSSGFLLGDAQIVEALQMDPEFGTGAEEMRQAQRRVGRDIPVSVQNLGDAIGWNLLLRVLRLWLPSGWEHSGRCFF
jgi:hypothetical protein